MTKKPLPITPHGHQMRRRQLPSIDELRWRFRYDQETGIIVHRDLLNEIDGRRADNTIRKEGYRQIVINRTWNYAHRVAFALMTGRWPHLIDHIDRDKANNKWSNLRETTASKNRINAKSVDRATYICRDTKRNRWKIRIDGKDTHRTRFCKAWQLRRQWLAERDNG